MYTIEELEVLTDMPFAVFVKDEEGKYVWCNKFFFDLAGVGSPEEVIGKTDYDQVWSEIAEDIRRVDKEVLEKGKTINLQQQAKIAGRGLITENVCKFSATLEGKKYLFGVSIIPD